MSYSIEEYGELLTENLELEKELKVYKKIYEQNEEIHILNDNLDWYRDKNIDLQNEYDDLKAENDKLKLLDDKNRVDWKFFYETKATNFNNLVGKYERLLSKYERLEEKHEKAARIIAYLKNRNNELVEML